MYLPYWGSPAIQAGDAVTCREAPVRGLDLYGQRRSQTCTVGAVEADLQHLTHTRPDMVGMIPGLSDLIDMMKPSGLDGSVGSVGDGRDGGAAGDAKSNDKRTPVSDDGSAASIECKTEGCSCGVHGAPRALNPIEWLLGAAVFWSMRRGARRTAFGRRK
jgi:hypothetical protein